MGKLNLSIYLIKEEITEFSDIVESSNELVKYSDDAVAYFKPSFSKEPDWLFAFFRINHDDLKTSNARVLFLKRLHISENETRIFGITFGYGKTLFKDEIVEEQFGLKIVLNTIERNKIRRISKIDIGKNYKQSQEQMPKESDIGEFGFDVNRDLIKYVTGQSDDEVFDKAIITGGDIFNLTIEKDVMDIDDLLLYCYEKYKQTTYRDNFDWIDNIKLIRKKSLIDQLNNEVVENFNNRNFDNVWLAIPEVISWEKFKCVYITGQRDKDAEYNDIKNEVFIESFENCRIDNYEQIKNKTIKIMSNEDSSSELYKWNASKCIVGSIVYENNVYAINGGNWYKINSDFAEEVNQAYNNLELSDLELIDCPTEKNEDQYNDELVNSIDGAYLIHKYKIPIGGGSGNNIEPCDIAIGKNLIHIKNNGGSSYLSHLFNQASNSCQALKDDKFRRKFIEKLNSDNSSYSLEEPFNAEEYTIVVGIINKYHDERPRIPFFSKVSIRDSARQIKNMGYKFTLKNIKKL